MSESESVSPVTPEISIGSDGRFTIPSAELNSQLGLIDQDQVIIPVDTQAHGFDQPNGEDADVYWILSNRRGTVVATLSSAPHSEPGQPPDESRNVMLGEVTCRQGIDGTWTAEVMSSNSEQDQETRKKQEMIMAKAFAAINTSAVREQIHHVEEDIA